VWCGTRPAAAGWSEERPGSARHHRAARTWRGGSHQPDPQVCSRGDGARQFLGPKKPHAAAGSQHEPTQISVSRRARSGSLFLVVVLLVDLLSKGRTAILLKRTNSERKLKQDSQGDIGDTGVSLTTTTQTPGYGYDPHQSQTACSLLQLRYRDHASRRGRCSATGAQLPSPAGWWPRVVPGHERSHEPAATGRATRAEAGGAQHHTHTETGTLSRRA